MKTPGTNIIKAFNAGVAPNRGAVFYLQNPTVRCGAVRCGAVKKGKKSHRTVAKHLIYPKGLTAVVFL